MMNLQKSRKVALVLVSIALTCVTFMITPAAQEPASDPDGQIGDSNSPSPKEPATSIAGADIRSTSPVPESTSYAHTSTEIIVSELDNQQYLPSVAYNWKHREYLVVWHNTWGAQRDVYAQRINHRGELLSWFAVVSDANDNAQPSVAYDPVNDRYLVVWVYDVNGDGSDWDIWGRFIPWQGPDAGFAEFPICTWNTTQWNPKIAYGRAMEEFMITWSNEYAGGVLPMYVSAVRIDAGAGTIGNPWTIDNHATEHRFNPDITYNLARNEYLIVWEAVGGNGDIWGVRLAGDGTTLGGGNFGIAGWPGSEEKPAVSACPASDTYYVTWQSYQGPNNYDVYGRFVSGDGTPGDVHHFDSTPIHEISPDVDCNYNSTEFLVVFEGQYSNTVGPFGIFGQTVTPAGLGDLFTIRGITAGEGANCTEPVVAGGGTNYLTVWEHDRPGTSFQDIHGRLSITHPVFLPGLER